MVLFDSRGALIRTGEAALASISSSFIPQRWVGAGVNQAHRSAPAARAGDLYRYAWMGEGGRSSPGSSECETGEVLRPRKPSASGDWWAAYPSSLRSYLARFLTTMAPMAPKDCVSLVCRSVAEVTAKDSTNVNILPFLLLFRVVMCYRNLAFPRHWTPPRWPTIFRPHSILTSLSTLPSV